MALKFQFLPNEISQGKAACPHALKDADSLSPPKIRARDGKNHASSETSVFLSGCSSHDSSSENAETKSVLRVSDVFEGLAMLSNVAVSQAAAHVQQFLGTKSFCANRAFLNNIEIQKVPENNGDDVSCISGPQSPSISGNHGCGVNTRHSSFSEVTQNTSLPRQLEKKSDVQLASCCLANSYYEVGEGKHDYCCRPTEFTEESFQQNIHFAGKSDLSTASSMRDVHTAARSLKGDLSKCSRKQEESSTKGTSIAIDIVESARPAAKVDEEDLVTAVEKHVDQCKGLVSPGTFSVKGHPKQSETVDCNDVPDLLVDVMVCDICGDIGRKDSLAICSKCSDGAEHIYCMRVKLEKVPEGDWKCEDCTLEEETDTRSEVQKLVRIPQGSSSNRMRQSTKTSDADISCLESETKGSCTEKIGQAEVSLIPCICAKRPAENLECDSIMGKRAIEGVLRMSSPSRVVLLSPESSYEEVDKLNVTPKDHASNSSEQIFIHNHKYGRPSIISGSSPSNSLARYPMQRGVLVKSNSFNIPGSKLKLPSPDEDTLEKHNLSCKPAAGDKRKHDMIGKISKSLSFNSVSSGHLRGTDLKIKMVSSNICPGNDSKNLNQRNCKAKLDNPSVTSPMLGSSVTRIDKKNELHGETMFLRSSGNEYHLDPFQTQGNSNISSIFVDRFVDGASNKFHNDQAGSGVVKQHLHASQNFGDPCSLTEPNSSHELKPSVLISSKDGFSSDASSTAGRHYNGSTLAGRNTFYPSMASGNLVGKANKIPYCNSFSAISREPNGTRDKDQQPAFCDQTVSSILAKPMFDSIWKGGFKIHGSGRLPSFCDGLQAHLSTCASSKVIEIVKKFPHEILLEEVSQSSVWPTQSLENHLKEDSIGAYFFAEDNMSYEQHYRCLIERMTKYELALKGVVDGIELLIFSSQLLPKSSQRWNKLFFLWGVFRGKNIYNEECMFSSMEKSTVSGVLSNGSSGIESSKDRLYAKQPCGLVDCRQWPLVSCGKSAENAEHHPSAYQQAYSPFQMKFDPQTSVYDAISSRIPMQKECCGDMRQASATPNEHGLSERRVEFYHLSTLASNVDNVSCGADRGTELSLNSRTTSPVVTDPAPVVHKFLDLDLSLGTGPKCHKQALVTQPSSLPKVTDENNKHYKHLNSIASNMTNGGGGDENLSVSVELSLAMPSCNI